MATKPELTPVQLAALDLMIAQKKANPNVAASFIFGIVHFIVKTAPMVTKLTVLTPAVAGHATAAAKSSQPSDDTSELDQIDNLSLEQLIEVRNKIGHK